MFKISHSKVSTYLRCLRRYELGYVHELKPIKDAKALEVGREYHDQVERVLNGQQYDNDNVLTHAFNKYIPHNDWNILETEKEFKYNLTDDIVIHGYIDAIAEIDGEKYIVEHKTTSDAVDEKYWDKLKLDNQILIYGLVTGIRKFIHTAVKKPTIRQRKNEAAEEYHQRCLDWYDCKEKCDYKPLTKMNSEIEDKRKELIMLAEEMRDRKFFPRNPSACRRMKCPFSGICLNECVDDAIGYVKKEKKVEVGF